MLWEQHDFRVTGVTSYFVKAIMLPLLGAAMANAFSAFENNAAEPVASKLHHGTVRRQQLDGLSLTLT